MKFTVRFSDLGFADGTYTITAPGYDSATLYWADDNGILEHYAAFAVVSLLNGYGEFDCVGNRAIPSNATQVIALVTDKNMCNTKEIRAEISCYQKVNIDNCIYRISLISDIHLSNKVGKITRALRFASKSDCIIIVGDSVNDGTVEQFKLFDECVNSSITDSIPLFSVGGNHDFSRDGFKEGEYNYWDLQKEFLERNKNLGFDIEIHESGCWSATNKHLHIFGWKCVGEKRNFFFGNKEEQLKWLSDKMEQNQDKRYQIVCSHAPLIAHNPQRESDGQPYFDSDRKLQNIIDSHNNIIFVSGHTHFSPNNLKGNVDYDDKRNNIYIDDGSVCPTTYKLGDENIPKEWTDGVVVELVICENGVEIIFNTLHSDKRFARGYYRFKKERR